MLYFWGRAISFVIWIFINIDRVVLIIFTPLEFFKHGLKIGWDVKLTVSIALFISMFPLYLYMPPTHHEIRFWISTCSVFQRDGFFFSVHFPHKLSWRDCSISFAVLRSRTFRDTYALFSWEMKFGKIRWQAMNLWSFLYSFFHFKIFQCFTQKQ